MSTSMRRTLAQALAVPMAKSPKVNDEQILLIDVDTPETKAVKKQIVEYEKLKDENREQGSANKVAEQKKREKVLESIQAANFKPDAKGTYHIQLGSTIYEISQEAQLRIKKSKAPSTDAPDDDEDKE